MQKLFFALSVVSSSIPFFLRHFRYLKPCSLSSTTTRSYFVGAMSSEVSDSEYPGTAVERMLNIRDSVRGLKTSDLDVDWSSVRLSILTAGGLKDMRNARPGYGMI
jgi:hypothetical protein